jgi:dihydrofolate reductase
MTKIVLWMQASLDGRAAGPNGEFDWPVVRDELQGHFVDVLRGAGMFLYGRRVYEGMAAYWPTADTDPSSSQLSVAFANVWKPMPKAVFSCTLPSAEWNTTILRDVEDVRRLRESATGDLVLFGGSEVVASFVGRDLIDEFQIFVHPTVLGGGAPLFPGLAQRQGVRLIESRAYDSAVVGLRYARTR